MEDMKYGDYAIIDPAGCGGGGFGKIFVAKKINDVENRAYVLKTYRGVDSNVINKTYLRNEIDSLRKLNEVPRNDYIPFLYSFDKYNIQEKDEKKIEEKNNNINTNTNININDIKAEMSEAEKLKKSKPYYVIDFFSKGELFYYIYFSYIGFGEELARVLFKKILLGIKFCHDRKLCHLDIKLGNIVLDKDYEPIIIDFGNSRKCMKENNDIIPLKKRLGTDNYMCPEMWHKSYYNGIKADIFSLGVVLFNLVTGKAPFKENSKDKDEYYKLIPSDLNGNYDAYWNKINSFICHDLSDNFKKLYQKMIARNPDDRPNNIQEILESDWMQEFDNLSPEERKTLDKRLKDKLKEIYKDIKDTNECLIIADKLKQSNFITRSVTNEKEGSGKTPKKIPNNRLNINHYIIIDGDLPVNKFMSNLIKDIKSEFDITQMDIRNCEEYEHLKFELCFYDLEKNDEDEIEKDKEEEEEKDDVDKKCIIEIELFQYEDGRYLLEFLRTKGKIPDYYNYFLEIKKIIKEKTLNSI